MVAEIAKTTRFERVRYAQCWEDADVLVDALAVRPGGTYLSIASAGDNALALVGAGAGRVIAVDLNPAQIACLELRVAAYRCLSHGEFLELLGQAPSGRRLCLYARCRSGLSRAAREFWDGRPALVRRGIARCGKFERYLALFRRAILPLIHSRATVSELFRLETEEARERFYAERWMNRRWKLLCRLFFGRPALGRFGRDPNFTRYADEPVWHSLQRQLPRALVTQRPAENPYLQWILTGRFRTALPWALRAENYARIRANLDALEWRCSAIEDVLAELPSGSVDGCNLSDVFEYVSPAAYESVLAELARCGSPGARLVYWNVVVDRHRPESMRGRLRPLTLDAARLHASDKAFFYRNLVIEEVCP
ncbi:MAG: BtaA family protein [Gammaproteobacteria bacterium]|nr:BtaA family protein [Gammaproteobacteria bacterium]MDH4255616.1 BtaA family protein [Gammaproteobacteria bacterium]MDH5310346.1 BtaA family protein [Gammaproteobacteria bacterium]